MFTILLCSPYQRKKAEQSIQMQLLAMQSIPMQSDVQAMKLRADELSVQL